MAQHFAFNGLKDVAWLVGQLDALAPCDRQRCVILCVRALRNRIYTGGRDEHDVWDKRGITTPTPTTLPY